MYENTITQTIKMYENTFAKIIRMYENIEIEIIRIYENTVTQTIRMYGKDVEKEEEVVSKNGSLGTIWKQCCQSPWACQSQKSKE